MRAKSAWIWFLVVLLGPTLLVFMLNTRIIARIPWRGENTPDIPTITIVEDTEAFPSPPPPPPQPPPIFEDEEQPKGSGVEQKEEKLPCTRSVGISEDEWFNVTLPARTKDQFISWICNPNIVVDWDGGPWRMGEPMLMAYRGFGWIEALVMFRLRNAPKKTASGGLAIAPWNPRSPTMAWLDIADRSIGVCTNHHNTQGFEDPRALILDGNVFVVMNVIQLSGCHRGMAIAKIGAQHLVDVLRRGRHLDNVTATSLTYLVPPGGWKDDSPWEKNWMPFVSRDEHAKGRKNRLLFVRRIEPHEIVECPISEAGEAYGTCEIVSSTTWPDLRRKLGANGDLRGSSAVVDRGDDFLTVGHTKIGGYVFFWYTFSKKPPYEITGASRPFTVAHGYLQYVSGMAAVDDRLLVTFSVDDRTSQSVWFRRCEVDIAVTEFQRPKEEEGEKRNASL